MIPAARQSAAISILDRWLNGEPVEKALTSWARASRFAGSGDREAVRDLVFQAVRQKRSAAALAGQGDQPTGRGLLIGLARGAGAPPSGWTGEGHAPDRLDPQEETLFSAPLPELTRAIAADCPDWLLPLFDAALGEQSDQVLSLMQQRAPIFVRVNQAKTTRADVQAELSALGIDTHPHPLSVTSLEVTSNPRRLRNSEALKEGRVEMQDAASQAVSDRFVEQLRTQCPDETVVLDYCAGGGGKSLALAAQGLSVYAHDKDPARMSDISGRAARAGAKVSVLDRAPDPEWNAILVDAPCSGSGSWRRAPEAKWRFSSERLEELTRIQDSILDTCAALCAPSGIIGYATCSLFAVENQDRVDAFLGRHPDWSCIQRHIFTPMDGGDGFFLAILKRG